MKTILGFILMLPVLLMVGGAISFALYAVITYLDWLILPIIVVVLFIVGVELITG